MKENFRRETLISAALEFAANACRVRGVVRIALVGSITTKKPHPKDVDVLVTITDSADIEALAKRGRQLKGKMQAVESGADIFLADIDGNYIGRTCRWKDCRPGLRQACEADSCGRVQYLYDDLRNVSLPRKVTEHPPVVLYPELAISKDLPDDLLRAIARSLGTPCDTGMIR